MLIQSETAKLAKEKGASVLFYDDNTYEYYDWESDRMYEFTQPLLQKWLREKHGIHVTPIPSYTDDTFNKKYFFEIAVERHIKLNKDMFNYYFKTYEEALEQGLLEGLKLIK